MSALHTPGPWSFSHRKGSDGMYRTEVFSSEHGGIATCAWTPKHCGNGVTATYREANARLMAAAPSLLEAAQAAWNCIRELPPTQARVEVARMLQAAIETAVGEQP